MTDIAERKKVWREKDRLNLSGFTLVQAILRLQEHRDEYGKDAVIEWRDYKYDDGQYLAVMVQEDETLQEMNERIAREKKWADSLLQDERKEFERLKAKFGG